MSQPPDNEDSLEIGQLGALPGETGFRTPPSQETSQPSPGKRRFLSAGLQAVLFWVISVVFWWVFGAILFVVSTDPLLLSTTTLFLATSTSTVLLMVVGQHRPLRELGLSFDLAAPREFMIGTAAGGVIAVCVVGTQWAAGWILIQDRADVALASNPAAAEMVAIGVASLLLRLLAGAAGEELLLRGYGLQQLMCATNPAFAIAGTSALFGLLHGGNPNASNIGLFNTALFGCFFALFLVSRRSLWTPFGAHLGWNLTLVATGASLSGLKIKVVGFTQVPVGPSLWTGGNYGPEASLLATIVLSLAIIVMIKLPRSSDHSVRLWD